MRNNESNYIRVGDTVIRGGNPQECKRLAEVAQELAKHQPSEFKTRWFSFKSWGWKEVGASVAAGTASYFGVRLLYNYLDNKFFNKKEPISKLPDSRELTDVETQADDSNCGNVTDSESGINLQGSSSDDLFSRPSTDDDSKWVVCGYMKVGQVNLMVAGGGVGKTILMVQIALAVARGARPEFLPDECCASVKLPVFYYRLEDFSDELAGKYGKGKVFNGSSITWFLPRDLKEFSLNGFIEHFKSLAESLTEDSLVCIDPATKLYGYGHTVFVKGVEEAMKIAEGRGIFLTPVATIHLDEIKDWAPLSICDIKGGDSAFQKAGSVTALRKERTDINHRFLQCLKDPKGCSAPFNGNVLVIRKDMEELDENNRYLHYEFECIKEETQARPEKPKAQSSPVSSAQNPQSGRTSNNQTLFEEDDQLLKQWKEEGLSNEEMKRRLNAMGKDVSFKTISRHLKKVL